MNKRIILGKTLRKPKKSQNDGKNVQIFPSVMKFQKKLLKKPKISQNNGKNVQIFPSVMKFSKKTFKKPKRSENDGKKITNFCVSYEILKNLPWDLVGIGSSRTCKNFGSRVRRQYQRTLPAIEKNCAMLMPQ